MESTVLQSEKLSTRNQVCKQKFLPSFCNQNPNNACKTVGTQKMKVSCQISHIHD